MSRRGDIEKISDEAAKRFDILLESGMDEEEASSEIIIEEYSKLQQEVITFKEEMGVPFDANERELGDIQTNEDEE